MDVSKNFKLIDNNVQRLSESFNSKKPTIIAVSKTFNIEHILPIINTGHEHFGENKVQEAKFKWTDIIKKNSNIKLHMLGNLQSNKAEEAVSIFDYVHSLDNEKLANKLFNAEKKYNKKLKYFIQVNLSEEAQKSGKRKDEIEQFLQYTNIELKLDVIGLMCLPKINENPTEYFAELNRLAQKFKLKDLSMGMSDDYAEAIKNGTTFIRIGSSIFGQRF
ncbi:COG0325 Predicted enzyme with a TIM-barrel fold [Candidatus Pelagibacterales bacterium]|jgi:pyridoxal phosphate enzyme (YggS family)